MRAPRVSNLLKFTCSAAQPEFTPQWSGSRVTLVNRTTLSTMKSRVQLKDRSQKHINEWSFKSLLIQAAILIAVKILVGCLIFSFLSGPIT